MKTKKYFRLYVETVTRIFAEGFSVDGIFADRIFAERNFRWKEFSPKRKFRQKKFSSNEIHGVRNFKELNFRRTLRHGDLKSEFSDIYSVSYCEMFLT